MQIVLSRKPTSDNATLGNLELPGPAFKIYATLEPWPTVIPAGTWPIRYEYSAKFKRQLWELKDVPGHAELKIHNGNFANHSDGCILIGMRHAQLYNPHTRQIEDAVVSSRLALEEFHRHMRNYEQDGAMIEVIDVVE